MAILVLAGCALTSGEVTAQELSSLSLPDSPGVAYAGQLAASASMSGTVLVADHGPAASAHVTLVSESGQAERVAETDESGHFSFTGLVPGTVKVTVTAPGLATYVSNEIKLTPGQTVELPAITVAISSVSTSVQVVVTEQELATEQVKAQEKQRVLGVFPNFYTSFLWEAVPLGAKQKYSLAIRSRIDPVVFATTAITAGLQQRANTYPGYGGGPSGYGKRYGAALADTVSERMLGGAILPSLFHQDPRYFYKGTGGKVARLKYAMGEAFLCRGDNGNRQVNYSYILGNFMAAGLSNAYKADEDRKASSTFANVGVILTGHMANDVIREFLLKRMTTNLPKYGNPKP
jgi:hypothetical protein